MTDQLLGRQKFILLAKFKKTKEKWARTVSHKVYLEECKNKGIFPRALNIAKHMKAGDLKSEEIFEIFRVSSIRLMDNQIEKWDKKIGNLNNHLGKFKEKLKNGLSEDNFKYEMEKITIHGTNVMNAMLEKKRGKVQRDTQEQNIIKSKYTSNKKRCRRFVRKKDDHETNVGPDNIEVVEENRINGKVKNISSCRLDQCKREVLELGPKFCPVERDLDRAKLQKDLNEGYRRMKIKEYLYPGEDSRSEEEKRFYIKNSCWEPPRVNKTLEVHNMIIQKEFDVWKQPVRVKDNLSVAHRKALEGLKNDEVHDIKLDDKSGSFVFADKSDYISAANNDIYKQTNIQETNVNSVDNMLKEVANEIARAVDACVTSGEILLTTADFIKHKVKEHKIARYYCNWKTHKYQPTQTEFALAAVRGIVSCSGTPDENLADYLDYILSPGMKQLRSYLKGTKDFLAWVEKLKEQYPELPPLFSFLTVDYCAMYPSMPDDLILPAVKEFLDKRTVQKPSTQKTMELLNITRNNNYFELGDKVFRQVGGTSIGKKHAPALCCLGAGKLEEEQIFPSEIFRSIVAKDNTTQDESDRFYKRFIDDMIAAMDGTEEEAKQFVEWLNTLDSSLKFTYEWSDKEITFLDTKLVIEDGKLETDRFVKPTNPQLFLHYSSNHPRSVFKAIIYGQAINVRMICSKDEYLTKHLNTLKTKFIERGYPCDLVENNLNRGASLPREDLLKPKPVYPQQASPTLLSKPKFCPTFIITYNPHNPPLRNWLKEHHHILLVDEKMRKIYPQAPSVSYRQPRNLKQILVRSRLKTLPHSDCSDLEERPAGCYKHQHGGRGRKCLLCPRLNEGKVFRSSYTGLSYKIRYNLTCKSKYIVYLITCQKCSCQYTGKTINYMHVRHCGHRDEVENRTSELGEHFANCGMENFKLQIIDCVKEGEDIALIQLEGVWQNRLATFKAHGNINIRDEMR